MNFVQEYLTPEQSLIDSEGVSCLMYSMCIIYTKLCNESYSQTFSWFFLPWLKSGFMFPDIANSLKNIVVQDALVNAT